VRVETFYRNDHDRELVDPLPEKDGWVFRLLYGDVCDPWLDPDGWFKPRLPFFTMRFWTPIPLPFFAWRAGKWTGYLGFKVYGVDSEHYLGWLKPEDVYKGSQAMCLSFRPFANAD
jgi:hypothetical protein